jgi:hypothetical protein
MKRVGRRRGVEGPLGPDGDDLADRRHGDDRFEPGRFPGLVIDLSELRVG